MSSEPETPARPSIFLSYASADRPAAREIRATLAKAGLEVWLDEEELMGGDAWDAKIRQQIRTCTYFMPIISAATESRREGYFRREWRLGVERNLDMADDVTFLVPVVIDATSERTARVPERFLSVHWTQCPGGAENSELTAMAERLMAEFAAGHRPRATTHTAHDTTRTAGQSASRARAHPFPVFPPFPERGHRERFAYDLVVWGGKTARAFWHRLPRWVQVVATFILIIRLLMFISGGSGPRPPDSDPVRNSERNAPTNAGRNLVE
jgi:hypothetical protein